MRPLSLNERHLVSLLREYVSYYNTERPHRSLLLQPPTHAPPAPIRPRGHHPSLVAEPSFHQNKRSTSRLYHADSLIC